MIQIVSIGTAVLFSVVIAADLAAQERPDSSLIRVLQDAASRNARVRLTAHPPLEGYVEEFVGGTLRLRSGETVVTSGIRQVDIGESRRSGALPGAVLGAVFIGPAISYFLLDSPSGVAGVEVFGISLAGILSGGVLGGLAGAALKPGGTHWQTVWPPAEQ